MMFLKLLTVLLLLPADRSLSPHNICQGARIVTQDTIRYYNAMSFDVIGRYHNEKNYGRFPAHYKNTLRENVC